MMKRIAFLLLLAAVPTFAAHSVTLAWTASPDSTAVNPGTISVYRAPGTCPASGIGAASYTVLTTTAPAGGPYVDTAVTGGATYCYYVVAVIGGAASAPSNTFSGTIPLNAPSALTGVVQ